MVDGITTFTVCEFGRCYCQVAKHQPKHGITSPIKSKIIRNIFTDTLPYVYKLLRLTFSSDLRKLCLITGKSLLLCWNNLFCSWGNQNEMMSNRMRSIHMHLATEYGKENVKIFCWWEKMENKMADFSNHRRFSLRCLSKDIIPVSMKRRSNMKTPKSHHIIRKA